MKKYIIIFTSLFILGTIFLFSCSKSVTAQNEQWTTQTVGKASSAGGSADVILVKAPSGEQFLVLIGYYKCAITQIDPRLRF